MPSIIIEGKTYLPHYIILDSLPVGFQYGGVIKSGDVKGNEYYFNPEIKEYVYVYQECYNAIGTSLIHWSDV